MIHPQYTEQFMAQRRFYLALPLLTLPFLTFIYWKLVAENLDESRADGGQKNGLLLSLPAADLTGEQNMDKLAYYRKADQDSASWTQQIKKDPYRQNEHTAIADTTRPVLMGLSAPRQKSKQMNVFSQAAQTQTLHQTQVHQRLRALDRALAQVQTPSLDSLPANQNSDAGDGLAQTGQLEKMMARLHSEDPPAAEDPEMAQLDGMLDKLLQLQAQQKAEPGQPGSNPVKENAGFRVSVAATDDQISLLALQPDSSGINTIEHIQTGFYGLSEDPQTRTGPTLTAVIEHTQQLVSGNTVQLRLTSALSVAGTLIPESTFIYGTCSLSGERLKIKITSLSVQEQILPVSLSVYDLDGIEGIYIPGAISRTVAKQQLGSFVQGYDLDMGGNSMGAQAASAGIQMSKMLLSKKTRLTQITLHEGYKVLLVDTHTTNQ